MARKYSQDLLDKLMERQEEMDYKGATILVKNLPDSDDKGAMDPRLYNDMKKQLNIMRFVPKSMMKQKFDAKGIAQLRKMFNGVKSHPIVEKPIKISNKTVKAADGYEIPVRIYESDSMRKNTPILYYIHGGGFFAGNLDVVEESLKLMVEKFDILAVSVDYRLAPENKYPTGHEDCYAVLKWIYEEAESFGADKNNIFVAGDSAGGNLTQYCTSKDYEDGEQKVKGQLLLYPTLNMAGVEDEYFKWSKDEFEMFPKHRKGLEMMLDMFGGMSGGLEEILGIDDAKNDYLNPYTRDPKGLPPTFITVGEHDYLKVECLAYAAKLTAAGIETKTVLYKGFGHAYFDNTGFYPQSEDCIIEMGNFILEHSK